MRDALRAAAAAAAHKPKIGEATSSSLQVRSRRAGARYHLFPSHSRHPRLPQALSRPPAPFPLSHAAAYAPLCSHL